MSQPYVGEIRMFAGNFAPAGWALCNGALVPISENETLFNLIGTTYGGDGQTTFALPDLRFDQSQSLAQKVDPLAQPGTEGFGVGQKIITGMRGVEQPRFRGERLALRDRKEKGRRILLAVDRVRNDSGVARKGVAHDRVATVVGPVAIVEKELAVNQRGFAV